ncbi:MAG TPA: hypothetical protein VHD39_05630 [Acidimicrobiales bacterium]|nr:hypothetical protein [Acidimicrobiales bacterium]
MTRGPTVGVTVLSALVSLLLGLGAVTPAQAATTTTTAHGSHGSHGSRPSKARPSKHANRTPPITKATITRGDAALVELSDLPSGWVAGTAAAAPTRLAPWTSAIAKCVGVPSSVASVKPVKLQSPEFTSSDHTLAVVDSVSVYPSAASAQAAYAALANPKTPQCMNAITAPTLQSSMQAQYTSGTIVGLPTFAALPGNPAASHVTGFTMSIQIGVNGRGLTITSTQVDLVHGTLLHQLTFNGNGTTFPAQLEVSVLGAAVRRGGSAS